MEIYFALSSLFVGYLVYRTVQLDRKIKEQDIAHKKALAEAGNAITETLRVAFDNLKKNSNEHGKLNSKLVEHNSRIHRLEQHISRTAKNFDQKKTKSDDTVFSQRQMKDIIDDENE